jgi:hypothetical protein
MTQPSKLLRKFMILLGAALLVWLSWQATPAHASLGSQHGNIPSSNPGKRNTPNQDCTMCHGVEGLKGVFKDGQEISLYVTESHYDKSVHSKAGLQCVSCHQDISSYPHSETSNLNCGDCHANFSGGGTITNQVPHTVKMPFANRREMVLPINNSCRSCHADEFNATTDSAHAKVMESGNTYAPVCSDCHGGHDIVDPRTAPRSQISKTCSTCHNSVYTTYQSSVHGQALQDDSNADVPTCIDCHGVHNVRGPRDLAFRDDSITICGKCHGNKTMMQKYGISTNVFESYLNDFHGRTVNVFRQDNGKPSNKAVCYDCHGIHNIRKVDDPRSSVYPANLLKTCQQCHKDASVRFPQAWLGHYAPSFSSSPFLFFIDLFYKLLIPGTLGFMFVYILLDAMKRWNDHRKHRAELLALANEETNDKRPE